MIAQLKQSLQQNATFERRNVEKASAEMSLKERMAALNNSANQWQTRAPRSQPPTAQRRLSSNVLQDLPILQKFPQRPRPQSLATEKPCDITSGLIKFFGTSNGTATSYEAKHDSNEINLDVITDNARPVLKTISRPRAPNRKKTAQSATFDERIRLDSVKIDEEELAEEDGEEAEKLETQEQAIAALKCAKQLLKSPTKKSPYPEVMLIQVRGGKHTDVRLVAPSMSSIHENACFVVVHQNHLMKYEGAYANILEKTKASQLCIEINGKSDLNCSAETVMTVTESSKHVLSKLLFSSENIISEETNNNQCSSEPFETTAARLNLVFRIAEDRSCQTCSRRERLSVSILQPSETLIFDFGSEIYVWTGRYSSKVNAAYALQYAKQLMNIGLKNGRNILGDSESSENGEKRPEWTLFRKIHQGVLDTLFKAKFSDWPESREVVTTCRPKDLFSKKKPHLKTYEDVKIANQDDEVDSLVRRMRDEPEIEPMLILEDQEIDRKMHDIITEDKSLWILGGEVLKEIEFTEEFDSTRCYVLRWKYRIQKSGVRRIKTGREEERETGRSRIAFFYWLGEHTTPKQHGLCALRIKDIDRDNSPRIRVADGNEPALFLALFTGKFLVSCGSSKPLRRFAVVGANSEETSLREVDDLNAKLRSHVAYIETTSTNGASIVCGANCAPEQVRFVLSHAEHLRRKAGVSGKAEVEVQGDKPGREWVNSNGRKRAMRMWRIFENEAEQSNHLSGHKDCAFTFSQQILTETILIDVGEALWLWSEDIVTTFALKVADTYWKGRTGPARVVYKGSEPEQFEALFMKWTPAEVENRMESRDVEELLKERCRTFTLKELQERSNLPDGMDMRRLESYLTDEDFVEAFGTSRSEFYSQKAWKQNEARKRAGLF